MGATTRILRLIQKNTILIKKKTCNNKNTLIIITNNNTKFYINGNTTKRFYFKIIRMSISMSLNVSL